MRLLSSRFFHSSPVAADQDVDPAGRGQSSEIGSLPCTNLYTINFETLRTCIHSTFYMRNGLHALPIGILCQFDWDDLHARMRQAVMIWHSSKVIGSPVFWNMLWEDKHCNSQKFKIKTWKQLPGLQYQLLSFAALPSCQWAQFLPPFPMASLSCRCSQSAHPRLYRFSRLGTSSMQVKFHRQ